VLSSEFYSFFVWRCDSEERSGLLIEPQTVRACGPRPLSSPLFFYLWLGRPGQVLLVRRVQREH